MYFEYVGDIGLWMVDLSLFVLVVKLYCDCKYVIV